VVDINFIRMFSVHTPVEGGKQGVYYSSLFTVPLRKEGEGCNVNASPTDESPIRPLIPGWPAGHPRLTQVSATSFCDNPPPV
jgi:hypothetical protein